MMSDAVARIDGLYSQALIAGILRPDPSLVIEEPLNAIDIGNAGDLDSLLAALPSEDGGTAPVSGGFAVQFDTPTAADINEVQGLVRAVPGVRGVATTSLALGGTSVMQVSFDGPVEQLRAGLEARGFTVSGAGNTLRITRRAAAPAPQPSGGGGGQ
jgi:hypothetical protein